MTGVVLHLVVKKRGTHDIAGLGELVGAHIALVVAEGQVDAAATAELTCEVVCGHEGTGRHTPCRGEARKAALHEDVEHAGGKDAAEAAAFQYERDVVSHGASLLLTYVCHAVYPTCGVRQRLAIDSEYLREVVSPLHMRLYAHAMRGSQDSRGTLTRWNASHLAHGGDWFRHGHSEGGSKPRSPHLAKQGYLSK